jgi:DNA-binding transcriptional LysR family regulator
MAQNPPAAPGWELYRSFLAVVRAGSLSGAARALQATQPTVGRHVDALEAALGISLFTRSQNGLAPTPAALEMLPAAEAMSSAAEALARTASGASAGESGTVRITASEVIGGEVLPALLADFGRRHPRVVIELALTNRTEDLLRRDADIAVRMARPTQQALVARRLGKVRLGLYAHRRYLAARGLPQSIDDLRHHAVIGFDRIPFQPKGGIAGRPISREMFSFRCDNDLAQLAALRAGVGIGGCQHNIARREPDLQAVLAEKISFELEMWLVMHRDQRESRRVRLLFDHLAAALTAYAAG